MKLLIKELFIMSETNVIDFYLHILFSCFEVPTLLEWDLMPPPLTPLGVENVKIQKNSGKIRGPLGTLYNPF